jgi:hypothetical protein
MEVRTRCRDREGRERRERRERRGAVVSGSRSGQTHAMRFDPAPMRRGREGDSVPRAVAVEIAAGPTPRGADVGRLRSRRRSSRVSETPWRAVGRGRAERSSERLVVDRREIRAAPPRSRHAIRRAIRGANRSARFRSGRGRGCGSWDAVAADAVRPSPRRRSCTASVDAVDVARDTSPAPRGCMAGMPTTLATPDFPDRRAGCGRGAEAAQQAGGGRAREAAGAVSGRTLTIRGGSSWMIGLATGVSGSSRPPVTMTASSSQLRQCAGSDS